MFNDQFGQTKTNFHYLAMLNMNFNTVFKKQSKSSKLTLNKQYKTMQYLVNHTL